MFKFLRSQAKIFYWVIAATFILFLFLGGMTGRGCQAPGTRQLEAGIIGEVNGTPISAQEYEYYYRQLTSQMRQQYQGRDLNGNQFAAAREQAWDGMVRQVIMDEAYEDLNITVSDAELLDRFQNNPPPEILANYRDAEGNLDMNRYYADLQNPENDWSRLETYVTAVMKSEKLQAEVTRDALVTDDEVREQFVKNNTRAVAEYMGVIYADLGEDYQPTEAEITTWYNDHPDDFESPAKAQCQVVRFAKTPSEEDYTDALTFVQSIREEILDGILTFEQAAAEYSEDGSANTGGDLGTFDRNRMVAPFTEAAFSLPVGQISEPVRTDFGYHLIEVLEQMVDEDTNEVFQVHARHILVKVTPGNGTLALIQESAEEFLSRVDGSSFVSTAEAEALDLLRPVPFIEGRDLPGIPISLAGAMWAFATEADNVSRVFENNDCFYVVRADGVLPAGPSPLEDVRSQVVLAVRNHHKLELAQAQLGPAVGEVQMGTSMSEAATTHNLFYAVSDTFTFNSNVVNVGYGTDFNKMAIEGTAGQLVPEIETLRGLFSLTPLWIEPFDAMAFEAQAPVLRANLMARAQGEALEAWFETRTAAAEIKDYRFAQ